MSKAEHLVDFCLKSILVQQLIFGTSAPEKVELWANLQGGGGRGLHIYKGWGLLLEILN